jgi:uncharacterized membrane protein
MDVSQFLMIWIGAGLFSFIGMALADSKTPATQTTWFRRKKDDVRVFAFIVLVIFGAISLFLGIPAWIEFFVRFFRKKPTVR